MVEVHDLYDSVSKGNYWELNELFCLVLGVTAHSQVNGADRQCLMPPSLRHPVTPNNALCPRQ